VIMLIGQAVEALLEGLTLGVQTEPEMLARFGDAIILVLRALADQRAYGPNWTGRQVTIALVDSRDEVNWNIDTVYLVAAMDSGHNGSVINFAMMLAKIYLIDDRSKANIIEVLSKIANHLRLPPDGLVLLVDMIKMSLEHNLAQPRHVLPHRTAPQQHPAGQVPNGCWRRLSSS